MEIPDDAVVFVDSAVHAVEHGFPQVIDIGFSDLWNGAQIKHFTLLGYRFAQSEYAADAPWEPPG